LNIRTQLLAGESKLMPKIRDAQPALAAMPVPIERRLNHRDVAQPAQAYQACLAA
jgi:hypothetical protein